jgi:hypothetical protein
VSLLIPAIDNLDLPQDLRGLGILLDPLHSGLQGGTIYLLAQGLQDLQGEIVLKRLGQGHILLVAAGEIDLRDL